MNKYIRIENRGAVEQLAFTLLGASSKREDDSKIGFFGSGNKYAIALLLRKKIPFRIFSGLREIKFDTKAVNFRGGKYEMITIDGKETSLTTDMGPTWEDWFIIREFYCNAIDEGGAKVSITSKIRPSKNKTLIFIGMTESLNNFFSRIEQYILIDKKNYLATEATQFGKVTILPSINDEAICYRKGIRVMAKNKNKTLYRYNFDQIRINESRIAEFEYEVKERIAGFFAVTLNKEYIKNYLRNWKGTFEESACWSYVWADLSPAWHEILQGHRVYPEKYAIHSGDYEAKLQSFIVPNSLAEKIHKSFPDIGVVGYSKEDLYKEVTMTPDEQAVIIKAQTELAQIGFPITCPIIVAEFFENDVVGQYDSSHNKIVVSRKYFSNDQVKFQNTLLEEYFHSKGQVDGQRTFVTFLINELINSRRKLYGKPERETNTSDTKKDIPF